MHDDAVGPFVVGATVGAAVVVTVVVNEVTVAGVVAAAQPGGSPRAKMELYGYAVHTPNVKPPLAMSISSVSAAAPPATTMRARRVLGWISTAMMLDEDTLDSVTTAE